MVAPITTPKHFVFEPHSSAAESRPSLSANEPGAASRNHTHEPSLSWTYVHDNPPHRPRHGRPGRGSTPERTRTSNLRFRSPGCCFIATRVGSSNGRSVPLADDGGRTFGGATDGARVPGGD